MDQIVVVSTGAGVGRRLMDRLVNEANSRGVRRLVLNTLPTMSHASALYGDLGFVPTESYVEDPTGGVLFFARDL
jgi:putative acetyltransferase